MDWGGTAFPWMINKVKISYGTNYTEWSGTAYLNEYLNLYGTYTTATVRYDGLSISANGSFDLATEVANWKETVSLNGSYLTFNVVNDRITELTGLDSSGNTLTFSNINVAYNSFDSYYDLLRGDHTINGTNNNDYFDGYYNGSDIISGFGGTDTVTYLMGKSNYTITKANEVTYVTKNTGYSSTDFDSLISIERLVFTDGTLALDIDAGNTAGQAYRLYQASVCSYS